MDLPEPTETRPETRPEGTETRPEPTETRPEPTETRPGGRFEVGLGSVWGRCGMLYFVFRNVTENYT